MEEAKIVNLYDLNETIAKDLISKYEYPWEVLPHISDYILEIGPTLFLIPRIDDDVCHKSFCIIHMPYTTFSNCGL